MRHFLPRLFDGTVKNIGHCWAGGGWGKSTRFKTHFKACPVEKFSLN